MTLKARTYYDIWDIEDAMKAEGIVFPPAQSLLQFIADCYGNISQNTMTYMLDSSDPKDWESFPDGVFEFVTKHKLYGVRVLCWW